MMLEDCREEMDQKDRESRMRKKRGMLLSQEEDFTGKEMFRFP